MTRAACIHGAGFHSPGLELTGGTGGPRSEQLIVQAESTSGRHAIVCSAQGYCILGTSYWLPEGGSARRHRGRGRGYGLGPPGMQVGYRRRLGKGSASLR